MISGREVSGHGEPSTGFIESLLEVIPVSIVAVDSTGTVTVANERAAETLHIPVADLVGRSVHTTEWSPTDQHGKPLAPADNPFTRAFAGESTVGQRISLWPPDLPEVVLRVNTAPVYDDDGTIIRVVATFEDVTEADQRKRELAAKNRQLESLASVLSHDLRNPLAIARGYVDLIGETGDLTHLEKVDRAHARMEELIDSLLLLSRRGRAIGPREPVSLVMSANTAWQHVETQTATLDVDADLGTLTADRVRLQQLFENLFRNAVEHGGEDVRLTVGPLPETVGFFLEDDGVGIAGVIERTALGTFVDETDAEAGLGLKIVHAIADGHGWNAYVAPRKRGGVRFEFVAAMATATDNE